MSPTGHGAHSGAGAHAIEVEFARFEPGFRSAWHSAPRAQLIYPSKRVMTLRVRGAVFVVPPLQACWLPAGEAHAVEAPAGLEMHSVYVSGKNMGLPQTSGVVSVDALTRQLIFSLAQRERRGAQRRAAMTWLLVDSIALGRQTPLVVPELAHKLLAPIAAALAADPADARRLEDWARRAGVSSRTLARLFLREAGMSFSAYRRQVRLLAAIQRLGAGRSVTEVAHDLGFGSASSFAAMFRQATGATPRRYFG